MAEINGIRCEVYPQDRGCERLFYGIGVDTRRLKGEREIKDHLKKDCRKRERQGGVEELECDGLFRPLAQRARMIRMMSWSDEEVKKLFGRFLL